MLYKILNWRFWALFVSESNTNIGAILPNLVELLDASQNYRESGHRTQSFRLPPKSDVLIIAFHRFRKVKHLPTADALMLAQQEIMAREHYRHPYYWAGLQHRRIL